MRTPRNDTVSEKQTRAPAKAGAQETRAQFTSTGLRPSGSPQSNTLRGAPSPEHKSERTCILTRRTGDRANLIRLALAPDGQVHPDVRAKAPGRGAWIGVTRAELETAQAKGKLKGGLSRAFKTGDIRVPDDMGAQIEAALSRAALERLGLEARASTLVTGSDRIEDNARKGGLYALYHASDAGTDGNRKLDQAWRVGMDEEGSARAGLVLAADRTMLSVALGRENVVHIGIIDARAAERVAAAIDRWHGFMGSAPTDWPCESGSQGSGPRGAANVVEGLKVQE